jgi:acyl carrier protein
MTTTISSRTPEGTPGECPVCGKLICIDPSQPTGDAPCPGCGVLLWFVSLGGAARLYRHSEVSSRKRRIIESLKSVPLDSLEIVEMVMLIEEEFGCEVDQDKIMEIRSMGDLIDYIIRELPD